MSPASVLRLLARRNDPHEPITLPCRRDAATLDVRVFDHLLHRLKRGCNLLRTTTEELCDATGASERAVRRSLARLEASRLIARRPNPNPKGGRHKTTFEVARLALSRDNRLPSIQFVSRSSEPATSENIWPLRSFAVFSDLVLVELRSTGAHKPRRGQYLDSHTGGPMPAHKRNARVVEMPLFGETRVRSQMRKTKAVSPLLAAYRVEWRDAYAAKYRQPYTALALGRELRDYKRFMALAPDQAVRQRIIAIYLADDDSYLVANGHALRLMLTERRLRPMLVQATEEVAERVRRERYKRETDFNERWMETEEYTYLNNLRNRERDEWQERANRCLRERDYTGQDKMLAELRRHYNDASQRIDEARQRAWLREYPEPMHHPAADRIH
jgi:hypothetical protein